MEDDDLNIPEEIDPESGEDDDKKTIDPDDDEELGGGDRFDEEEF